MSRIITYPNDLLTNPCSPVKTITTEHLKFIEEMREYLDSDPKALAVASNQLGKDYRIFVIHREIAKTPEHKAFVNPSFAPAGNVKSTMREGCLSLPDKQVKVSRHLIITAFYQDEYGKNKKERLTSLYARAFQHEFDHLEGKTILMYG